MSRKGHWQVALFLLSAASAFAADNAAFGTLKGELSVSSGGVANYSIPLNLPNSRGSFLPKLAIEYSSQVDDGALGVGFRVTGTSSITRCSQTMAQDGKAGRVSFDDQGDTGTSAGITDRFCLDGARLILVSGSYGFDGSEYRTQVDTQQRIRFYRPATGQPYFQVNTKDGRTLIYGDSADSILRTTLLASQRTYAWLLRKVSDNNSNYYEYAYKGSELPGSEQLIKKISYGANAAASKPFDYQIDFVYSDQDRPDKTKKYANAAEQKNEKLLQQVAVKRLKDDTVVSKLILEYEQGLESKRSRINSIKQCNRRSSEDFDCVKPTTFAWTDKAETDPAWVMGDASYNLPVQLYETINGENVPRIIRFVDLDGDGDDDLIWFTMWGDRNAAVPNEGSNYTAGWTMESRGAYLNSNGAWVPAPQYRIPDLENGHKAVTGLKTDAGIADVNTQFVDVNGDGLVDIVTHFTAPDRFTYNGAPTFQVRTYAVALLQVSGNGSESSKWISRDDYLVPDPLYDAGAVGNTGARFADLNGDGLPDYIYSVSGLPSTSSGDRLNLAQYNRERVYLNTPGSSSTAAASKWGNGASDATYALPQSLYKNAASASYTTTSVTPATPGDIGGKFIDLNGDGLLDYIYYRAGSDASRRGAYINDQGASGTASKWKSAPEFLPPTPLFQDPVYATMSITFPGQSQPTQMGALSFLGDLGVRFVDLNNDGLTDMIYSRLATSDNSGNAYTSAIVVNDALLNTGTGWLSAPEYKLPDAPAGATIPGPRLLYSDVPGDLGGYFIDVNGDNLVDFISHWAQKDANNNTVLVDKDAYVNTGSGWLRQERYIPPESLYSTQYRYWGGRVGDLNGDGVADLAYNRPDLPAVGNKTYVSTKRVDLLSQVNDGFGFVEKLTFKTIADSSVYLGATNGAYPGNAALSQPVLVLAKRERSAGTSGGELVTTNYKYGGLKTSLRGLGGIGFETVQEETTFPAVTDAIDGAAYTEITTTTYSQDFPYFGFIASQSRKVGKDGATPVLVADKFSLASDFDKVEPYAGKAVYVPFVKNVTERQYDAGTGALLSTKLTVETVDGYANVRGHKETVTQASDSSSYVIDTANTYLSADLSKWQVARLETQTTSYQRTGVPLPASGTLSSISRKRKLTYTPDGWHVYEDIQEPDPAEVKYNLVTTYQYDDYGNVAQRTVSAPGDSAVTGSAISPRVETIAYGAGTGYEQGVYPSSVTKVVSHYKRTGANESEWLVGTTSHTTSFSYDPVSNRVLSETDANNVSRVYDLDAFGLQKSEQLVVGINQPRLLKTTERAFCSGNCQAGESYYVVETPALTTPVTTYYDALGREVRKVSKYTSAHDMQVGSTSGDRVSAAVYDTRGLKICESLPMSGLAPLSCSSASATGKWVRYAYDGLRRQVAKREPATGETTTAYSGLVATVQNAKAQKRIETRNAMNELVSVTDAANKTVRFVRDAAGSVLESWDPKNNVITSSYDKLGRKIATTDPDMGTWQYKYNAAGEQIYQLDALQQETRYYYDELGRLYRRAEPDLVSAWKFDTAANGIGKVALADVSNGYQETFVYDIWGRNTELGTQIGNGTYVIKTGFDDADRVVKVTYPTDFSYKNNYDDNGFLTHVQDDTAGQTAHPVFWEARARDVEGRVTLEAFANGLKTEREYYSSSGRINTITTGATVAGGIDPGIQNESYSFDDVGNLDFRSQSVPGSNFAELFEYDELNRIRKAKFGNGELKLFAYDELGNLRFRSDVGVYSYSGCGGVHRVCSITNRGSFTYDLNGNMLSGNGRSYSRLDMPTQPDQSAPGQSGWTSFNMPSQIVMGTTIESFLYGDEHQRARRVSNVGGQTTTVDYVNPRIDLGGTYEKAVKPDGAVEHTQHIYADGRVIGAVMQTGSGTLSAPASRYFHQDHVGSIVAVTDESGQLLERLSYDIWGKRRSVSGQEDVQVTTEAALTDMALPVAGTDRYNLINRVNGELVMHSTNVLRSSPLSRGPATAVDQTMRLESAVDTTSLNSRHRSFLVGVENLAAGTTNYRRYAAMLKGSKWLVQTCVGTAPCITRIVGEVSASTNPTYVVEVTSTIGSSHLRIYEQGVQPVQEFIEFDEFDMSAGGLSLQKRPVAGVEMKGNFLPIGGTMIPFRRKDSPVTVSSLEWKKITPVAVDYDSTTTRHGFTLHEQLDSVDLVHMNGRVYDPAIGRFLSADPNVFYPENTQDYNRYSYVWNNPLSLTDPDGFCVAPCLYEYSFGSTTFQLRSTAEGGLSFIRKAGSAPAAVETNWQKSLEATRLGVIDGAFQQAVDSDPLTRGAYTPRYVNSVSPEYMGYYRAGFRLGQGLQVEAEVAFERAQGNGSFRKSHVFGAAPSREQKVVAKSGGNAADGLKLQKSLASQAQMGEAGTVMAGAGSRVPFRGAQRAASEHGGNAADWEKMKSSVFTSKDGTTFRTHWLENAKTGQRVEFKTKLGEAE